VVTALDRMADRLLGSRAVGARNAGNRQYPPLGLAPGMYVYQ
jgi:hypothetical protein